MGQRFVEGKTHTSHEGVWELKTQHENRHLNAHRHRLKLIFQVVTRIVIRKSVL